jgi:hypothetical protein
MADAALRELERRWRESGADEDRARWLAGRARAGELTATRLALAAHAGDVAARLALGPDGPPVVHDLTAWAHALAPWGSEALARAALAAARAALPPLMRGSNPNPELPRLLRAAEGFVHAPGRSSASARLAPPGDAPHVAAGKALARAVERAETFAVDDSGLAIVSAARCALWVRPGDDAPVKDPREVAVIEALLLSSRAVGRDVVRAALTAGLAPWALGEADPLARLVRV